MSLPSSLTHGIANDAFCVIEVKQWRGRTHGTLVVDASIIAISTDHMHLLNAWVNVLYFGLMRRYAPDRKERRGRT